MRRADLLAIAFVLSVSSAPGVARAASFQNTTGLASPGVTITFSEHILTSGDLLTNQYSDLGVTFANGMRWSPIPGGPPHIDDYNITNFLPNQSAFAPQILFNQPVTEFAIAMSSGYVGTMYLQAYYLGNFVEATSIASNSSQTNNYIGFTGILFDQLYILPSSFDNTFVADNLQYSVVPEPATALLLIGGLLGLGVLRRS
jgi:hypothetical protein